jgi:hypothetical protein
LEITRVAGTMSLCGCRSKSSIAKFYDFMDQDVKIIKNSFSIEVDRALYSRYKTNIEYRNVYVDLDDTLIFNNKVNASINTYVCQNINKSII